MFLLQRWLSFTVLPTVLLFLVLKSNLNAVESREQDTPEGTCTTSGVCDASKTVLVTGSNGFVASWIVKELLEQGYSVHAAVRDASIPDKVNHLKQLTAETSRLIIFSTGDLGSAPDDIWDAPLKGCHAVIHSSMAMGWRDGRHKMYEPTLAGTRQLLHAIERHTDSIRSLILTSSTAAVATQDGHAITDESHWRNAQEDIEQESWYSATKIAQEQMVTEWAQTQKKAGILPPQFQFVSIVPTRVLGPPIVSTLPISGWIQILRDWLLHPPAESNDTIEFVHVQDVARMHIAALEHPEAYGRYLCVDESWHWNELLEYLQQLQPKMIIKPYKGDDDKVPPKQFSKERRNTLDVAFRSMKTMLRDAVEYLEAVDELGGLSTIKF
ncbi:Anthocyanidin reductase ((2S)-flavan-3-ol-forming) [Seminavis robusta]|uniref:Anthocyanidin reductase ((2S)-flavan-3-ol-forming) n=1 Tax=Seminavis robusta TaxID=568900 RepID=A0A9N8EL69_9STRA|nr:Anthocyanidin reductase ((2S)-flavan-3-ol-forming) [Seminavis robusta]|eukprot:Sro1267_g257690.1 Anthocyanidin reductase ((2S)-flavan-3-ol-forming) (383) ;mRNA; f:23970-25118